MWLKYRKPWFNPWFRKIPRSRKWHSTPVFLPGESCRLKSPVVYILLDCKSQTQQLNHHIRTTSLLEFYMFLGDRKNNNNNKHTCKHRLRECMWNSVSFFFFVCPLWRLIINEIFSYFPKLQSLSKCKLYAG